MTGSDETSVDTRGVAHAVEIEKMIIQNHAGQNVDVRAMFSEYTSVSSLFEPGIHGSVTIHDAHSLLTRHPIVGEETLHVSFKTPGNEPKTHQFAIWRVTDETPDDKGTASVYTLHFCAKAMLRNASKVIAKSYTDTDDAKSILRSIAAEGLSIGGDGDTLEFGDLPMKDPAKKLVVPMYRPLEAIDMVLRRAYSGDESKSDYYLFFERYDGWRVYMFDELVSNPINARQRNAGIISQEDLDISPDASVRSLETWYEYASIKYQEDSNTARDIRRVITMTIHGRFDTLSKIRMGAFENEVVTYSIVEKALASKNYKALRDEVRLIGGPPNSDSVNDRGGNGKERTNTTDFLGNYSTTETGFSGTQASRVFFRMKDPEEKDGVVKKSGWRYAAARTQLSQVQVTIVVPGDTMVDVGDVVHLSVPKFESVLERGEKDDFIYGRYVVGTIKDAIMSPDKHVMTLDLVRDAYASPITISEVLGDRD